MSDNAVLNRGFSPRTPIVLEGEIDFMAQGNGAIGCYTTNLKLPANHSIVNVDVYTVTALAGASATISIGYDDPTTEPDNMLNDEAVASFATAGLLIAGIQRLGTAATKTEVGTADIAVAYEIKTTALTAGVVKLLVTCLPTA